MVSRNERENEILEKVKGAFLISPNYTGPSLLAFGEVKKDFENRMNEMTRAYSKKGSLDERKSFEQYRI